MVKRFVKCTSYRQNVKKTIVIVTPKAFILKKSTTAYEKVFGALQEIVSIELAPIPCSQDIEMGAIRATEKLSKFQDQFVPLSF